jgi:hypothetical protein
MLRRATPLNFFTKLFTHPGKVKGGPGPIFTLPGHASRSVKNLTIQYSDTQWRLGFMTFALDKNPVCSMVRGSKLTGEPDASKSPQGSGK